jgi:channel protein (hemolysin III family)
MHFHIGLEDVWEHHLRPDHASRNLRTKARLEVFDHSAIYLLIAGTYTPFTLAGSACHVVALAIQL